MTRDARIPVVDQLRGLAAASVAWFHLTNGYDGWVAASGAWGWLGVEAFFVISGFVIPYALSHLAKPYQISDFPGFMARRIVRLEPPYLASIALVIVLDLVAASTPMFRGAVPDFQPLQVGAHLFYLIPLTDFSWIQPVYWTLAYEFVFYVTIGLLFPFVGAQGRRHMGRSAAVLVIALVAIGVVSHLLALFIMGFVVHRRLTARDDQSWTLVLIAAAAAAMIAQGAVPEALVGVLTALIILFHKAIPAISGRVGAMLTGLGAISYSLYLVHVPIGGKVVNLGRRFVDGDLPELALSLVALALSLVVAAMFWRFIEQPATAAARRLRFRTRPIHPQARKPA